MMRKSFSLVVVLALFIGCQKRASKAAEPLDSVASESPTSAPQPKEEDEMEEEMVPFTYIIGGVIERKMDEAFAGTNHPCAIFPCIATVEVVAISKIGMDYHGQYDPGSVLEVFFNPTLEAQQPAEGEQNTPQLGLMEGDQFEAELRARTEPASTPYQVLIYTRLER